MITSLVAILGVILVFTLMFGSQAIMQFILNFIYWFCKYFLIFIDYCQSLFRSLAGLPNETGGTQPADDLLFDQVLHNSMVKNAFLAILLLSCFLVFGFAIVQIIRQEWTTEGGKNAKGPIIKSALKTIFLFFLIPFCSLLGVFVSNQLLGVVDRATASNTTSSIAGLIFKASVKDANPIRRLDELINVEKKTSYEDLNDSVEWVNGGFGTLIGYGIRGSYDVNTGIYWDSEAGRYGLEDSNRGEQKVYFDNSDKKIKGFSLFTVSDGSIHDGITADELDEVFSRYTYSTSAATITAKTRSDKAINLKVGKVLNYSNQDAVYYCYNMHSINYIILIVGGYFALSALTSTMFGLVMRMYKVAVLFIISPYPVALSVLDNGSALNKWKGKFISELFSAYGVVVGLNLFFVLLPVFNEIKLFTNNDFFNDLTQLVFVLVGCYMIKDIVGLISEFTGGGDTLKTGEGMKKQVKQGVVSGVSKAVSVATGFGAGAASALSVANQAFHAVGQSADNMQRKALVDANSKTGQEIAELEKKKAGLNKEDPNYNNEVKKIDDEIASKRNIVAANSKTIAELDYRQDARTAKLERGRSNYLRSKQVLVNKFAGNKAFQAINGAAGGILTAEGRAKLDKAAAGSSAENAALIKSADKDRQAYGKWGRHINSKSALTAADQKVHSMAYDRSNLDGTSYTRQKGDSFFGFARKGELDMVNREVYQETYRLAMDTAGKNNVAVDHVAKTLNASETRKLTATAATAEIEQAKVELASLDISPEAKKAAGKQLDTMLDAFKHNKTSNDFIHAMDNLETNEARANTSNITNQVVKARISAEDLARMNNNNNTKAFQKIVSDPDYSNNFKKIILQANEESAAKANAMKNDQKTANVVPDLIRQVINVLKDDKKK